MDTDSGRNFTCVASNPAVPMGKRATVTLNIHRMLDVETFTPSFFLFLCVCVKKQKKDKNAFIYPTLGRCA